MTQKLFAATICCLLAIAMQSSCSKENINKTAINAATEQPIPNAAADRTDCGWNSFFEPYEVTYTYPDGTTYTVTQYRLKWYYIPCPANSFLVGGVGGGTTIPFLQSFPIPPATVNIDKIDKFIKCIKPGLDADEANSDYYVGIYVDQPDPITLEHYVKYPNTYEYNFGATYLYLAKKEPGGVDEEVVLMYLPTAGILGNSSPYSLSSPANLAYTTAAFECDIAYKQEVSALNFNRILNRIKTYMVNNPEYNVLTSNSTDFVLNVTQPLGLGLGPAIGNLPGGSTANLPAVLGQHIGQLSPPLLIVPAPTATPLQTANCL